MNRRALLALLAAVLLLFAALRPAVESYLSEPLGLVYAVTARYIASLPQIYLWAGLLGLFVVIGLRRIPLRTARAEKGPANRRVQRGRLGDWVRLLADRRRGAYFEWRLANRLAALERWMDSSPEMPAEMRRYLQIGRTRRTIEAGQSLGRLNFRLERLVGYLEDALDRS